MNAMQKVREVVTFNMNGLNKEEKERIGNIGSNNLHICKSCWELIDNCKCEDEYNFMEIDAGIADVISELNKAGISTRFSCAGHIELKDISNGYIPRIYVMFNNPRDFEISDSLMGWKYTKTNGTLSKEVSRSLSSCILKSNDLNKINSMLSILYRDVMLARYELLQYVRNVIIFNKFLKDKGNL